MGLDKKLHSSGSNDSEVLEIPMNGIELNLDADASYQAITKSEVCVYVNKLNAGIPGKRSGDWKSVFGSNIAVFSNSAGLHQYDPDGRKTRAVEFKIGIKVVRHKVKKPARSAEEIEKHFGCDSTRLIMVGYNASESDSDDMLDGCNENGEDNICRSTTKVKI
ncbi:hypothetical protein ACET3Z_005125 [Daucus carota]